MAQEALKKLEEQLVNCPICLETYADPKLLQCHHVYCRKCLVKLVKRDRTGKCSLVCPNCRHITPVPAKGVESLQSAFLINKIQDSLKELKDASVAAVKEANYCSEHPEKELEVYCEKCVKLTCPLCLLKGGKHFHHDHELLSEAIEKYSEEFPALLEEVDEKIGEYSESIEKLDSNIEEVDEQLKIFERQKVAIQDSPDHETRLSYISQQEEAVINQKKELQALKNDGLGIVPEITTCRNLLSECGDTGNKGRKIVALKQATKHYRVVSPQLLSVCKKIDQIQLLCLLDPLQCQATGKGLQFADVRQKSTVTLSLHSYTSKPFEDEVKIECDLLFTQPGRTKVQGRVERVGLSQYQISYHPTITGEHFLHITANGQHIKGSPFDIKVFKTAADIQGYPVHIIKGLQGPAGIAVDHQGTVFISEREHHSISAFSSTGKKLGSFQTRNLRPGKVEGPYGITLDSDGNIFMTVMKANRIFSFTARGKSSRSPFPFHGPRCIAFNEYNGKLYVASENNDCIYILNSNLTTFKTFQWRRNLDICALACDSNGRVYVADTGNNRILVFTPQGNFLKAFGRYGSDEGELDCPVGVAVDSTGIVYVSEEGNHRISLFSTTGYFVTSIGRKGHRPGEFECPGGIAVDANRTLYVCDGDSRVQAFSCKHVQYKPTIVVPCKDLFLLIIVGFCAVIYIVYMMYFFSCHNFEKRY